LFPRAKASSRKALFGLLAAMSGAVVFRVLVVFVGDVVLRLQEMLLQLLLGVPAAPRGITHFTRGFGSPGVKIADAGFCVVLPCRQTRQLLFGGFFPGVPCVLGVFRLFGR
jgi:hypothetical protein